MIKISLIETKERFSIHILGHATEDISKVNKDCVAVSTFAMFLSELTYFNNYCYLSQGRGECSFSMKKDDFLRPVFENIVSRLSSNQVQIERINLNEN